MPQTDRQTGRQADGRADGTSKYRDACASKKLDKLEGWGLRIVPEDDLIQDDPPEVENIVDDWMASTPTPE